MANFAMLDENNIVTQVITIYNNNILDENGVESEDVGIDFCRKLFEENTNWKQTSYNNNMRVRHASIGYSYNQTLDAFIPPQPFSSWVLNEETADWQSPLGLTPELTEQNIDDGFFYVWDESTYEKDNTNGWILKEETPYEPLPTW